MAQFGRPVSVKDNTGGWTDEGGGSTTIYDGIDESVASDADYIQSPLAPSAAAVTFGLTTTLEDPVSSSSHILRWRRQKSAAGGATINMTVELRQGYVSEASQGTLIDTTTDSALPDTWTDTSSTLSAGEADAITDYTDLSVRFVATQA